MESKKNNRVKKTPYFTIFISFFAVILFGTIMFMLPISTTNKTGLTFIEDFFMSTSATCVTGLSVLSNVNEELSIFGKIVMLILIEIGGLSFLTVTIFIFILIGQKVGIVSRFLLREALNQNNTYGIVNLVKNIVILSFVIQFIGSLLNTFILVLYDYSDFWTCLGTGIFHSISAFNNAGLDIFGNSSMIQFKDNIPLNISTIALILMGGIGFIVIIDMIKNKSWRKYSIHTKIVLITTLVLLILPTLIYKLIQPEMTFMQALFQTVTCRTAGFSTFNSADLNSASQMLTLVLMFIGASPCSTGGGIKTTTIFVIFIAIISLAKNKKPKIFYRRIADQSITKAFSLAILALSAIVFGVFLISIFDKNIPFNDIIFEVVSAFGTVGLSRGITAALTDVSKLILCGLMLFGRLGPLTVISIWNNNWMKETNDDIEYVEEKVIIG